MREEIGGVVIAKHQDLEEGTMYCIYYVSHTL